MDSPYEASSAPTTLHRRSQAAGARSRRTRSPEQQASPSRFRPARIGASEVGSERSHAAACASSNVLSNSARVLDISWHVTAHR